MFYYYGRKKALAKHYPDPAFDTIVEPFAGAAAYSLYGERWQKQVILIERDEQVAGIWEWLIGSATVDEIAAMSELQVGDRTSEFLHIMCAVSKRGFSYKTIKVTPVLATNWNVTKRFMAQNLYKIKHWQIICGDYSQAPSIEATWFIDPPYKGEQGTGYRYGSNLLDYEFLAKWVLERSGEVICCEGVGGDYLPFVSLGDCVGVAGKRSKEYVFHRIDKESTNEKIRAV